jgi:TolA-binding protein
VNQSPKEHEMNKRRERYTPVAQVKRDRALTAEMKVKELRLEVHDLKKQLFRAQESARIANEEADMRAQAQRQSGEALRAQLAAERDRDRDLFHAFVRRGEDLLEAQASAAAPLWRIAAKRLAVRFGRAS